ncbi:hypothetical protein SFUMM280S_06914 [Streptomyces fumanus]
MLERGGDEPRGVELLVHRAHGRDGVLDASGGVEQGAFAGPFAGCAMVFPPVWRAPAPVPGPGARVPRQRLVMSTGIRASQPSRSTVASIRP